MMKPSLLRNKLVCSLFVLLAIPLGLIAQPTITSFTPTAAKIGDTITITGTNFSTTAANNIVDFYGVRGTVATASSTSLKVVIPSGAQYGYVSVTTGGKTTFSQKNFNPTVACSTPISSSTFVVPASYKTVGSSPQGIASADIDGDGKLDIAAAANGGRMVSILRNISTSGKLDSTGFAPRMDIITQAGPFQVALGDLNADGKPDMVVGAFGNDTLCIFENTSTPGNISFGSRIVYMMPTGRNACGIKIADMDADGLPEIVTTMRTLNFCILKNNLVGSTLTSSTFTRNDFLINSASAASGSANDIAVADMNLDGKLDIVIPENVNSAAVTKIHVHLNTGPLTFVDSVINSVNYYIWGVSVADIDGDGKPDISGHHRSSNLFFCFRNTSPGTGVFTVDSRYTVATSSAQLIFISTADLNGDGKPDLVGANLTPGNAYIIPNNSTPGTISFATPINIGISASSISSSVADFDGDKMTDIVFVDNNSKVYLMRNRNGMALDVTPDTVCSGATSASVDYSITNGVPTQYSITWTATSLAAGFSHIINQALPSGSISLTVPGTLTPGVYAGTLTVTDGTCTSEAKTIEITVRATPTITPGTSPSVIEGATTASLPYTATSGSPTTYTIDYDAAANTAGFTDVTSTSLPVSPISLTVPGAAAVGTYNGTLKVSNGSCESAGSAFTVQVTSANAAPVFTGGATQSLSVCQNSTSNAINDLLKVDDDDANQPLNWSLSSPPAKGTATVTYSTTSTGDVQTPTGLTYTPTAGYSGTDAFTVQVSDGTATATTTINVTVSAAPTAFTVTGGGSYCSGGSGMAIGLSGSQNGHTYQLYRGATAIGSAVSGTGSAISFGNQTTAGTYTVVAKNTTTFCEAGMSGSVGITVKPIPDVNTVTNKTLCNSATQAAISFSGSVSGTAYDWSNNTTSIGLGATGTGDISSFTATNTTTSSVTAAITVTPSKDGCTGSSTNFTITVKPTPVVSAIGNQTLCNGATSAAVSLSSNISGTTFSWSSNEAIGLSPGNTSTIPSFTAANTTNAPVVATVTVSPTVNSCTGADKTFTITVNPTPAVNTITNKTVCNGATFSGVAMSGPVIGTSYSWTNNQTSIGLAASGSGDISSFNAVNTGTTPVVATITVTPQANSCTGSNRVFTITVNPTPTANAVSNQSLCHGGTALVNFTGAVSGTTYNWTNNNTATGIAASGSGNISTNVTNTTTAPVTSTIVVTPVNSGCTGASTSFSITAKPNPSTNGIAPQSLCNNVPANVTISGPVSGTTYNWTNSNTAIGLAASGNGSLSFTPTNSTTGSVTANIAITPVANGCTGNTTNVSVTVNPTPVIGAIANQTICNGIASTYINIPVNVGGANFSWTNTNSSIGLPASGTGNIPVFTAANTSNAPVTASVTITPSVNGCTGNTKTVDFTVNPTPSVTAITDKSICNNSTSAVITTSGPVSGTTFAWTNSQTSIGLPGSGTGNIPSFTATNMGTTSVVSLIAVTPAANGCTGSTIGFSMTVKPTPAVGTINNKAFCNGATSPFQNVPGTVAGTTFVWANNAPSIGLAASGTGNIPSFATSNTTAAPVIATITITPAANGCTGPDGTYDITVNPTPTVTAITDKAVCNNATSAAITLSGPVSGTTFTWSNNQTSIGLSASGAGNIPSFTATNGGTTPVVANIAVTPTANGCTGTVSGFKITANPTPSIGDIPNQAACHGANTMFVNIPGMVAGTTFAWTNDNTATGLTASGTGNISSFTATNTTTAPLVSTISVTPTANSCSGSIRTFTITAKPIPTVNTVSNQVKCNNAATTAVAFSGPVSGTSFSWTNNNTATGLAASGSGNISSFTATNTTNAPISSTIAVTPAADGCVGTAGAFTITVSPTPMISAIAGQTRCNGTATSAVIIPSTVSGATFTWTNNNSSIGLPSSGTGNLPSFTATNTTTSSEVGVVAIVPTANGCTGPVGFAEYTVHPTPTVDTIASSAICNNVNFAAITLSGPVDGSTFAWTNNKTSVGLAANGTGDIPGFTALNTTTAPVVATISAKATANGCVGTARIFNITVNPTPTVNTLSDITLCNRAVTPAIGFTSPVSGATYTWTNSDTTIGLPETGSGSIDTFTAKNATVLPTVATITVRPTANNCIGIDSSYTITVNPTPMLSSVLNPSGICNKTAFSYVPTSATPGTTFAWARAAVTGISNTQAAGTNNPGETLDNTTPNPINVKYTYTLMANGCSNTQTVGVVINPTPKLTSPLSTNVCAESRFSYVPATLTAGTTYTWSRASVPNVTPATRSGSGNIIDTMKNATKQPIAVTYNVTLTANGCSSTEQLKLRLDHLPEVPVITIMPPLDVCAGTMYQNFGVSVPPAADRVYHWVADNAVVWAQGKDRQYSVVNFPKEGKAVVKVIASVESSSCSVPSVYEVNVKSEKADQPEVTYFNGRFVSLFKAKSYQWGYDDKTSMDSTLSTGETGQDYYVPTPDFDNKYYWVMTMKDGCMQKSYYNKPLDVDIPQPVENQLKLYPNPATDKLTVELKLSSGAAYQIVMYDVTGRMIRNMNASGDRTVVDVAELPAGVYTISCYSQGVRMVSSRFAKN